MGKAYQYLSTYPSIYLWFVRSITDPTVQFSSVSKELLSLWVSGCGCGCRRRQWVCHHHLFHSPCSCRKEAPKSEKGRTGTETDVRKGGLKEDLKDGLKEGLKDFVKEVLSSIWGLITSTKYLENRVQGLEKQIKSQQKQIHDQENQINDQENTITTYCSVIFLLAALVAALFTYIFYNKIWGDGGWCCGRVASGSTEHLELENLAVTRFYVPGYSVQCQFKTYRFFLGKMLHSSWIIFTLYFFFVCLL